MNTTALPRPVLPNAIPHGPHPPSSAAAVSPQLIEAARAEAHAALRSLNTTREVLSTAEAESRLRRYGPNVVAADQRRPLLRLLFRALVNRLVVLLVVIAGASFATGNLPAGCVILAMVALGVVG